MVYLTIIFWKMNQLSSNVNSFGHFLFISIKEEGAPSLVIAIHVDDFSSMKNKIGWKLVFCIVAEGMVFKERWLITAQLLNQGTASCQAKDITK